MIFVKRDPSLIPERLLKVAQRAQAKLETLPAAERVAFIKGKSHIWRAFKRHLRVMSYGKCWYSEAVGPQSFYDVDHFRPKSEARRSETVTDDGYPWLAFDWDNFRFSAERSNRPNNDEENDDSVGKSSWFPLVEGSPIACWDDRCVGAELPMLLDPTRQADVALLKVRSNGLVGPSGTCVGTGLKRVAATLTYYGLNLPNIRDARLDVMRDIGKRVEVLLDSCEAALAYEGAADAIPVAKQREQITKLTMPYSPFSLAARAKLSELGVSELIGKPEDMLPLAA